MSLLSRVNPDLAAKLPKRPEPPQPVVDNRPQWLRRRDDGLLRAKILSSAT